MRWVSLLACLLGIGLVGCDLKPQSIGITGPSPPTPAPSAPASGVQPAPGLPAPDTPVDPDQRFFHYD